MKAIFKSASNDFADMITGMQLGNLNSIENYKTVPPPQHVFKQCYAGILISDKTGEM